METIPQVIPLAQAAADLDIPVSTARHWIKSARLQTELKSVARTRVLFLPPETVEALRARKQQSVTQMLASPPIAPIEIETEVTATDHVTQVTETAKKPSNRRVGELLWKLLLLIGWALLLVVGKALRALLVLHTSEKTVSALLAPVTYRSERAPAMKLRRAL